MWTDEEVESVAQSAQYAFWKLVSEKYPNVKKGDLCWDLCFEFDAMCEKVITEWLSANWPDEEEIQHNESEYYRSLKKRSI